MGPPAHHGRVTLPSGETETRGRCRKYDLPTPPLSIHSPVKGAGGCWRDPAVKAFQRWGVSILNQQLLLSGQRLEFAFGETTSPHHTLS